MRDALDAQNGHSDALQAQIAERHKALTDIEDQIARLVAFVAGGGDRLDYVAEKLRLLEIDARAQRAEVEVLRRTSKKPLREIAACDVDAAIAQLLSAKPEEVEAARLRLRRWAFALRFDGGTLEIEIDPASLVADVAHGGTPLPSYPSGTKLVVRMPVGYMIPRTKVRHVGVAA